MSLATSPFPRVREAGTRLLEIRTALTVLLYNLTAIDLALKGFTDARTGRQIFPAGNASTDADFQREFEANPAFLEQALTLYENGLSDQVSNMGGGGPTPIVQTDITLVGGSAGQTGYTFPKATWQSRRIRYCVARLSGFESGELTIVHNNGVVLAVDMSKAGVSGMTFSADISGANVRLNYSLPAGDDATLRIRDSDDWAIPQLNAPAPPPP